MNEVQTIIENSAVTCLARVEEENGTNIQVADITSVTVKVFDGSGTLVNTLTFDVDDIVSDTLRTDARWTKDSTGYNVAIGLSGANFPTGDEDYQPEAKFNVVEGNSFYVRWKLHTENIWSE